MKKILFIVLSITIYGASLILSPSCSKTTTPAPSTTTGINISSVTSTMVTLNNQNSSSSNQFYVISSNTFVSTNSFDLAYGNGAASGNQYFIGGPSDASVQLDFNNDGGGTNQTLFYTLPNYQGNFDTLVNKAAVPVIAAGAVANTPAGDNSNYRINSTSPWSIGYLFAIKTSGGTWVIAKVTSVPTGTSSTPGSVGLQLKY